MELKPKDIRGSALEKARQLYLMDEYTDESIAAAVGVSFEQLQKWANAESWKKRIEDLKKSVLERAMFLEQQRRVAILEGSDDKSAKLIEGMVARFLRDQLGSGKSVSAPDVRALVVAIQQLQKLNKGRPKR